MTEHKAEGTAAGVATATATAMVIRGAQTWAFSYVALGFAIAIEGEVIAFLPLRFPLNEIVFLVATIVTGWIFLFSGQFQEWLLATKSKYESLPH